MKSLLRVIDKDFLPKLHDSLPSIAQQRDAQMRAVLHQLQADVKQVVTTAGFDGTVLMNGQTPIGVQMTHAWGTGDDPVRAESRRHYRHRRHEGAHGPELQALRLPAGHFVAGVLIKYLFH